MFKLLLAEAWEKSNFCSRTVLSAEEIEPRIVWDAISNLFSIRPGFSVGLAIALPAKTWKHLTSMFRRVLALVLVGVSIPIGIVFALFLYFLFGTLPTTCTLLCLLSLTSLFLFL